MNTDLFSACVFCAAWLLKGDMGPPPGYSAEMAAGYATLQRQNESHGATSDDRSDVTAKFIAIGLGWAQPVPEEGIGAGTPASEWKARASFPNSHDEADEGAGAPDRITATGDGRYENYGLLGRVQLGARDSIEGAFEQRRHRITDLVDLGGSKFQVAEERDLTSERIDLALGWRHRWNQSELAAQWLHALVQGKTNTAMSLVSSRGNLDGAAVELRARRGQWIGILSAQALTGTLPGSVEFSPDFASAATHSKATLTAANLEIAYSAKKYLWSLSAFGEDSRLPFVSLAVLGAETRAFDSGSRPDSRAKEWGLELSVRREVARGVWPQIFYRSVHGNETVTLVDQSGARDRLSVRRGGGFPGNQFVVGAGMQFSIGSPARAGELAPSERPGQP